MPAPKKKPTAKTPVKKAVKKKVAPTNKLIPKPKQTRSTRKMTFEIFEKVCKELESTHQGLKTICSKFNTSSSAFFDLLDGEKEGKLSDLYTRARKRQAEYLFDLQREVVWKRDEDHTAFTGGNVIQRDRLIADTIKWQTTKLNPKKYGEKIDLNHSGSIEVDFSE
jgi:hypothetical protein